MDATTIGIFAAAWLIVSCLVALALGGFVRSGTAARDNGGELISSADVMTPGRILRTLRNQETGTTIAHNLRSLRPGSKRRSARLVSTRQRSGPEKFADKLLASETTSAKRTPVRH